MKRTPLILPALLLAALLLAAACAGEKVVETVVVEREVPVEKKVVETVVVEREVAGEKVVQTVVVERPVEVEKKVVETVVVEKEVKETVVVEKEKVVIATPVPTVVTFFGLPIPKAGEVTGRLPTPKSAANEVVISNPLELRGTGVPGAFDGHFYSQSVQEKFFTTDKAGDPVPRLAETWTVAPDLSYIDIKVKERVQWHGGFGELTADDVVWTFNKGNPGTNPESVTDGGASWVSFLGSNAVTKIDKYTARFTVAQFTVLWDSFLFGQSGLALSVCSKAAYDQKGDDWALTNAIGTGPFRVVSFARDDHLKLERVATVHHALPEVEKLVYRAIPDEAVAEAMLETGAIDIGMNIPLRNYMKYTAMGFKVIGAGAGSFHSITFAGNYWEDKHYVTGAPITHITYANYLPWIGNPFNDKWGNPPAGFTSMTRAKQVRTALAMAYDRDMIAEVLFAGAAWPTYIYGHDINNPYYQSKWDYPYDPAVAGRMLDEVGFPLKDGKRFELPFFIRLGRGDEEIGTAVAGYWRELGIDVQEFRAQYQVFRPQLIARSAASAWIHSAGVEGPQQPWDWPIFGPAHFSSGRPGFNIGLEDKFYADTYYNMAVEPDRAKRIEIRNSIAEYTHEWAVSIGTVAVPAVALINPQRVASWDMPLNLREACCHHPELIKLAK